MNKQQLNAWCDALEAHPEQQITQVLAKTDGTGFCCLGKFCDVMGYPYEIKYNNRYYFGFYTFLVGRAATDFGSDVGLFSDLNMPCLIHEDLIYCSYANANDAGVPWPIIAAHARKHHPTTD